MTLMVTFILLWFYIVTTVVSNYCGLLGYDIV